MRRRTSPEVNAGSMADIAFLLLIFFLVTTTIDKDKGIARQLPAENNIDVIYDIKQKNLLSIIVNENNELLVNNEILPITLLKDRVLSFIDNGGYAQGVNGYCDYCNGDRDIRSSDNPQKAVVALAPDRLTEYGTYVKVQNEITIAYNTLRDIASKERFNFVFTEIDRSVKEDTYKGDLVKIKEQLKEIRKMYPMIISEAETKKELRL